MLQIWNLVRSRKSTPDLGWRAVVRMLRKWKCYYINFTLYALHVGVGVLYYINFKLYALAVCEA